ncbi:MAG: hypothetical protein E7665_01290 [Ruminococcaceae bacterium]|nr:hypothetical protein [Oscillospiraceae bacterium]
MARTIRYMTFNIQHGYDHLRKDGIRLSTMADIIKRFSPDIVSLNEVRGGKELEYDENALYDNTLYFEQTSYLARLCGYEHCFFGRSIYINDGEYGNALLSRFPIDKADVFPVPDTYKTPDKHYESRTILRASFSYPESFDVFISHFGVNTTEEREKAVKLMLSLTSESKKPCIISGDFNDTPDAECLKPLYESFNDTLEMCGEKYAPSFISTSPDRRIDYIFISRDLGCESASVPADAVGSDHLPVVADIKF